MTISYDFFLSAVLEVRVVPLEPTQRTLPREGVVMPDVSTALFCGIIPNTTDYVSTWITPDGGRFSSFGTSSTAIGQDVKYRIVNGNFGERYPQGSIFTINRLSYLDSGNYTCSIEFNSNVSDVHTGNFELTLLGKTSMLINNDIP